MTKPNESGYWKYRDGDGCLHTLDQLQPSKLLNDMFEAIRIEDGAFVCIHRHRLIPPITLQPDQKLL